MNRYRDTAFQAFKEGEHTTAAAPQDMLFYEKQVSKIGYYGRLRRKYLVNNRRPYYISLLKSGKLEEHLRDIDNTAQAMSSHLTQVLYEQNAVHSIDPLHPENLEQTLFDVHRQIEKAILSELVYL